MARATCRCGQELEMPPEGVTHTTCPRCSARVRIIRKRRDGDPGSSSVSSGDGFIRFSCPCGRRLKVSAIDRPTHGKCPDCDRIVPVPDDASSKPASRAESSTEEMAAVDLAMLDAWAKGHMAEGSGNGSRPISTAEMAFNAPGRRAEAGFRVCPRCGKPIHLNADTCRACGIPVPKK
jgi:ribosomal protein L37E